MMRIKREFLAIASEARAEDGTKLEPEEQPIQRVMETVATATRGGVAVGGLPVEIVAHTTAQEMSAAKGRQCYGCKHWRHEQWRRAIADADGPDAAHEDRQSINKVRAAILGSGNATITNHYEDREEGGPDVEKAMNAMGICGPLTENERATDPNFGPKEWVVTFPTACCPMSVVGPGQPYGFFEPRDSDAERGQAANYDAVMLRAAGKIP